jgi:pilus assembly protein Flp/PilA
MSNPRHQPASSASSVKKTPMMRTYFDATARFLQEEDGPTAVEYAVVLALIVGVCIASVGRLAVVVGDSFESSSESINAAMGN